MNANILLFYDVPPNKYFACEINFLSLKDNYNKHFERGRKNNMKTSKNSNLKWKNNNISSTIKKISRAIDIGN